MHIIKLSVFLLPSMFKVTVTGKNYQSLASFVLLVSLLKSHNRSTVKTNIPLLQKFPRSASDPPYHQPLSASVPQLVKHHKVQD